MSLVLAPFGLRAAYHPSGIIRAKKYKVVDATQAIYGTALYNGAPVVLTTTGAINVAAAGADWLGVFAGCEYNDSTGKPTVSPFLPATPTGITQVYIYVIDDPLVVFEVQCEAAVANTALGDQLTTFGATYTAASGSTATGLSTAGFSGTLAGAGAQGMARIIDVGQQVDNAWGDTYTIVQVQNARHQYVAVKVAV